MVQYNILYHRKSPNARGGKKWQKIQKIVTKSAKVSARNAR